MIELLNLLAYTAVPDTDVDIDSPVDEDLMEELRDNIDASRVAVFGVSFTERNTQGTSFSSLVTFDVTIPDLPDPQNGRSLTVALLGKVDDGPTRTGTYRISDGTTDGTEDTTTSATNEEMTSTITVPASWAGTTKTIQIQGKIDSSPGTEAFRVISQGRVSVELVF